MKITECVDLDQTCVHILSCFRRVQLSETIWTVAHQVPLSMGFSRQEYWSGLPCPPAGDLSNPGIKPMSFMSPALAGRFFATSSTWEAWPALHFYGIPRNPIWGVFKIICKIGRIVIINKLTFKRYCLNSYHRFTVCVAVGLLALIQVQKFPLHPHRLELNSHQKPTGDVWYFLDTILFMISEKKIENIPQNNQSLTHGLRWSICKKHTVIISYEYLVNNNPLGFQ